MISKIKLQEHNYCNLKKYNIPLELALVRPFSTTNTYKFILSQGNVKGCILFLFLIISESVCKKLEKLNHKLIYTSLV